MARNKLVDLNNHLFEQLERLNDEGLKGEKLNIEIKRAKAMNSVAKNIVDNARITLEAAKHAYNSIGGGIMPAHLLEEKPKTNNENTKS